MKILEMTDSYIYLLTKNNFKLKLLNPGHKDIDELYGWLEIIANDYDTMMKENNKRV